MGSQGTRTVSSGGDNPSWGRSGCSCPAPTPRDPGWHQSVTRAGRGRVRGDVPFGDVRHTGAISNAGHSTVHRAAPSPAPTEVSSSKAETPVQRRMGDGEHEPLPVPSVRGRTPGRIGADVAISVNKVAAAPGLRLRCRCNFQLEAGNTRPT